MLHFFEAYTVKSGKAIKKKVLDSQALPRLPKRLHIYKKRSASQNILFRKNNIVTPHG